jgi:hypothetical protein
VDCARGETYEVRGMLFTVPAIVKAISLATVFVLAPAAPTGLSGHAEVDRTVAMSLVERSSDIFAGRIDILTASLEDGDAPASEYTVLVTEVLKGDLRPGSIVVIRVASDGALAPGAEYLLVTRYEPALLRYVVFDTESSAMPAPSGDERAGFFEPWMDVIRKASCPFTDVLSLDGVVYARRDWNGQKRYLEREWVGPSFATVAVQDTSANGCRDDLSDGTASEIPVGTRVHELDGYARTFRVSVRLPDRHRYLYEAIWSERAETGEELLDIRDRVKVLAWTDTTDCREMGVCSAAAVALADPEIIRTVVNALLDAVVSRPRYKNSADFKEHFTLTFELDDGSSVTLSVDAEAGVSRSGIRVPVEEIRNAIWGDL